MGALSQSQQVVGKLIGWWLGESKRLLGLVKKGMNCCVLLIVGFMWACESNTRIPRILKVKVFRKFLKLKMWIINYMILFQVYQI